MRLAEVECAYTSMSFGGLEEQEKVGVSGGTTQGFFTFYSDMTKQLPLSTNKRLLFSSS